jgi:hypothetical protein
MYEQFFKVKQAARPGGITTNRFSFLEAHLVRIYSNKSSAMHPQERSAVRESAVCLAFEEKFG